jgi:hypothetical protein
MRKAWRLSLLSSLRMLFLGVFFNWVYVFAFGYGCGSCFGVAFVYSGPAFVFKWELAQQSEDTTLSCNVFLHYATFLASIPCSRSFHVPHPTPTIRALTIPSYRTPSPFVYGIRPRSEEALTALAQNQAPIDLEADARLERETKEEEVSIKETCNKLRVQIHEVR